MATAINPLPLLPQDSGSEISGPEVEGGITAGYFNHFRQEGDWWLLKCLFLTARQIWQRQSRQLLKFLAKRKLDFVSRRQSPQITGDTP
jgi:hypothetical protein